MRRTRRKGTLDWFGTSLTEQPAQLLELLLVLGLALVIWQVGYHGGGALDGGTGPLVGSLGLLALGGVGSLWAVFQRRGIELPSFLWWSAPGMVYLAAHSAWLAPAGWRAEAQLGLLWQGWAVAVLVGTMVRERWMQRLLLFLLLGVVLVHGLDLLGFEAPRALAQRLGPDPVMSGDARFGVYPDAPSLAWVWVMALPLAAVCLGLPRFPGYVRMASGGFLLFGAHQLAMTGNAAAWATMGIVALVLPFFLRSRWRARLRVGALIALLATCGLLLYRFSPGLPSRVEAAAENQPAWVEPSRWEAALRLWAEKPVLGGGLDSHSLRAEGLSLARPVGDDERGARQVLLSLLSETGLVGLGLALLALVGTFGRWLWRWRREPFFARDREAEFRHASGPGERAGSSRRRRRSRRSRRSRGRKVMLGGLVLGMAAAGVYTLFEAPWHAAVPVLLLGAFAGVAERLAGVPGECPRARVNRFAGVVGGLAIGAISVSFLGLFQARAEVFAGNRVLAAYEGNEEAVFLAPAGVYDAQRHAERAIDMDPMNAEAWALLAQARLAEEIIARRPLKEIGNRVQAAAEQALQFYSERGSYHFLMAEGLALAEAPHEAVEAAFTSAAERSPRSREILLGWARYRFRQANDPEGAARLLDRLLEWNPDDAEALAQRRLLGL